MHYYKKELYSYNSLFVVVSSLINGSNIQLPEGTNYDWLYNELKAQALISLTSGVLNQLQINSLLRDKWKNSVAQSISYLVQIQRQEEKIIGQLRNHGIACAVLKGSAAALYYPQTIYRTFGDIDVFVRPSDYEISASIIAKCGYRQLGDLYEDPRNITFTDGLHSIELHRHFFLEDYRSLDNYLYEALEQTQVRHSYFIDSVFFTDEINGLILLQHLRQHINGDLGLRQLIDWVMFVSKVCDDAFWNEKLCSLADSANLVKLAKAATLLGKKYFGLNNQITWCDDIGEDIADKVLIYALRNGNFGIKSEKINNSVYIAVRHKRNIKSWINMLQESGEYNLQKRHITLVPSKLAWIYGVMVYVKKSLIDGALVDFFRNGYHKKAVFEKELYNDLGL